MSKPTPETASTIPLRIIQVVNVRWFNATAWYGLFLSHLLREAGHEVKVVALGGTESFAKAHALGLDPESFALNSANPLVIPSVFNGLRRMVKDFQPHIVNCHRGESFALWAFLKKYGQFGLVRTRGDQRPPKSNVVNKYIHAHLADALIVTCSGIAGAMRDVLHVPPDRVHTIFGGVDTKKFYPDPAEREAVRRVWGIGPEHLAVGLVGRFDAVKGQKELIEAFAMLRRKEGFDAGKVRLVLAGFATSSTSEEDVTKWVREAGLEGSVILPGRCDSVRGLMAALDVGVVASLGSETIARVALEIMACGVPLMGTRVGVMPDLLTDEALVPPGDPNAMMEWLFRFATQGDCGMSLRTAQAQRMQTLTEKDFLNQTLAVYRKVVGQLR